MENSFQSTGPEQPRRLPRRDGRRDLVGRSCRTPCDTKAASGSHPASDFRRCHGRETSRRKQMKK